MKDRIVYRLATEEDSDGILAVYAPYVLRTAITFEYEVPAPEAFRERVRGILRKFPYAVALRNGGVIGYAYASPYRTRAAYGWDAELSVYVAPEACGKGVGTRLYAIVLDLLRRQGYRTVYGVVTVPNTASEKLHEHFGFRCVGRQRSCGYKLGAWHDNVLFERSLSDYPVSPEPPTPLPELDPASVREVLRFYGAEETV